MRFRWKTQRMLSCFVICLFLCTLAGKINLFSGPLQFARINFTLISCREKHTFNWVLTGSTATFTSAITTGYSAWKMFAHSWAYKYNTRLDYSVIIYGNEKIHTLLSTHRSNDARSYGYILLNIFFLIMIFLFAFQSGFLNVLVNSLEYQYEIVESDIKGYKVNLKFSKMNYQNWKWPKDTSYQEENNINVQKQTRIQYGQLWITLIQVYSV